MPAAAAGAQARLSRRGDDAVRHSRHRAIGASMSLRGETATYRPFALPGDATLWAVQCRRAGTVTTHWYQASGAAGLPVALALPDGDRGQVDAGERGFEDSVFDFDFGILRARSGPLVARIAVSSAPGAGMAEHGSCSSAATCRPVSGCSHPTGSGPIPRPSPPADGPAGRSACARAHSRFRHDPFTQTARIRRGWAWLSGQWRSVCMRISA